jgi:hypothetical protein
VNLNFNLRIRNNIPQVEADLARAAQDAITKATLLLETEVKKTLSGERTGRSYKIPHTNRRWRASAPYQAPAVRLGNLRQSYTHRIEGHGWNTIGYVGNPLEYAEHLEYGTRKMAIRPHLRKTFWQNRNKIKRLMENLI